jgi:hypothetical protein
MKGKQMTEPKYYTFSYQDIVKLLVKQEGIHEGLWSLRVELGLAAVNVNQSEGSLDIIPAALIPIKNIGIQQGMELNALTVDAAVVNPRPNARNIRKKK